MNVGPNKNNFVGGARKKELRVNAGSEVKFNHFWKNWEVIMSQIILTIPVFFIVLIRVRTNLQDLRQEIRKAKIDTSLLALSSNYKTLSLRKWELLSDASLSLKCRVCVYLSRNGVTSIEIIMFWIVYSKPLSSEKY